MRISDHIICLLRNLYAGQEATIKAGHGEKKKKLDMEQQTGCQNWERGTSRLHIVTCLFNLYAEYIMRNAGLNESRAGIKIPGRNINNLRYADDTTLMA